MDLNLTTIVNNSQENNQLLLNAIKSKFAAKTATEAAAFSPPNFSIPALKTPGSECTTQLNNGSSSSTQLNEFLLKQLQQQTTNGLNKTLGEFVLPNLQTDNKLSNNERTKLKCEIPAFQTANTPMSRLTTALNKLQVGKDSEERNITKAQTTSTSAIDLTSALALNLQGHKKVTRSTRDFKNLQCQEPLDFEIPFIDCDRIDVSRKYNILLPSSNEYCVADVSQMRLKHTLVEPSAIGRVLNSTDNKYTEPPPLDCFSAKFQQQSVKHTITPFLFDTKSPDDLVMDALNKYQRRFHI